LTGESRVLPGKVAKVKNSKAVVDFFVVANSWFKLFKNVVYLLLLDVF